MSAGVMSNPAGPTRPLTKASEPLVGRADTHASGLCSILDTQAIEHA